MLGFLKKLFGPAPINKPEPAPYKVETAPVVESTVEKSPEPIAEVVAEVKPVVPAPVRNQRKPRAKSAPTAAIPAAKKAAPVKKAAAIKGRPRTKSKKV
jgi:hypothetical protein